MFCYGFQHKLRGPAWAVGSYSISPLSKILSSKPCDRQTGKNALYVMVDGTGTFSLSLVSNSHKIAIFAGHKGVASAAYELLASYTIHCMSSLHLMSWFLGNLRLEFFCHLPCITALRCSLARRGFGKLRLRTGQRVGRRNGIGSV